MPLRLSLSDIPVDVLLDNLLPFIGLRDLLNLACTCRFFAILGERSIERE